MRKSRLSSEERRAEIFRRATNLLEGSIVKNGQYLKRSNCRLFARTSTRHKALNIQQLHNDVVKVLESLFIHIKLFREHVMLVVTYRVSLVTAATMAQFPLEKYFQKTLMAKMAPVSLRYP